MLSTFFIEYERSSYSIKNTCNFWNTVWITETVNVI